MGTADNCAGRSNSHSTIDSADALLSRAAPDDRERASSQAAAGPRIAEEHSLLRQIGFLDTEIAEVDRVIALAAIGRPEVARLTTVPGVNVTVAATCLSRSGDIRRFPSAAKLVGYLGLD